MTKSPCMDLYVQGPHLLEEGVPANQDPTERINSMRAHDHALSDVVSSLL